MRDHRDVEVEGTHGGVLGLRISNAIGRLLKELVGRGPDKVRTYIDDDLIVCVLEGGLTRAERTLQSQAGNEPVVELRLKLQAAMRPAIVDAVQAIVGREVRSCMSASDPSTDLEVEVILLSSRASAQPASTKEELDTRRRQALDATRSLREDHAALMAEQAQVYKSLRRRTDRPSER